MLESKILKSQKMMMMRSTNRKKQSNINPPPKDQLKSELFPYFPNLAQDFKGTVKGIMNRYN